MTFLVGDTYLGINTISGEEVAIKLESVKAKHPQLEYESKVYKTLAGGVGVPFVRWFGTECDYNAMAIDLLGPSLKDLFNFCNRKSTFKTVFFWLTNSCVGVESINSHLLTCTVDLSRRVHPSQCYLTGTARYTSINTHLGVEQARRDNLESLAYVLMYLLRGALPWRGLKVATKKQKYDRIMEKKMTTPPTFFAGFPNEFGIFLNYTHPAKTSQTTPICANFSVTFSPVRVTSTTMCSTGVSSTVPRMRWRVPVLRQRAVGVKLSRRMRASHEPATDSKNPICFTTIFRHQRSSCRLRSHTRQMQATAPGAIGRQRATGARRDSDLW
jgi:casein kinase I homolog HRR25